MNALEALRRLAGAGRSAQVERWEINARQYWLLVDLFGALSERRERMSQLRRSGLCKDNRDPVRRLYRWMSLAMAGAGMDSRVYLATFVGIASFLLFSILVSEISNISG
jgi:hypothetical protein